MTTETQAGPTKVHPLKRIISPTPRSPKVTKSTSASAAAGATENAQQDGGAAHGIPKQKLRAFERFKKLGKKKEKTDFPPAEWGAANGKGSVAEEIQEPVADDVATDAQPLQSTDDSTPKVEATAAGLVPEDEAITRAASQPAFTLNQRNLAAKIRDLLSSRPPFFEDHDASAQESGNSNGPGESDTSTSLTDFKLLGLLASSSFMNGSSSKGRRSIWTLLDHMPHPPVKVEALTEQGVEELELERVDNSSIMLCAPLIITPDTEVEIAKSEIISIEEEELDILEAEPAAETDGETKISSSWWPFGKAKEKVKEKGKDAERIIRRKIIVKEARVWIPSKTKVSLQASWWGYRIYLPPPVLLILDDTTLDITKKAALLTSALQWILNNVPTAGLPPQLQVVLSIVKALVPILGYIGGFVAWSWSAIKSFDKGEGVVLSATWLLPIALIPGAWDFKEPVPEPTPEPSPPADQPTPQPGAPSTPTPAPAPAPDQPADPSVPAPPTVPPESSPGTANPVIPTPDAPPTIPANPNIGTFAAK